MKTKILENEYWFGPEVFNSIDYPLDTNSEKTISLEPPYGINQTNPILLSTKGRYIYSHNGFTATFSNGEIEITVKDGILDFGEGYGTLSGAFSKVSEKYFPSNNILPPDDFFLSPQFNTWIELIHEQNQNDILEYAKSAVTYGFKPGILMIDDLWSNYYGKWDFDRAKFPDPKSMIEELHSLGFKVIMWICPFVSLDSAEFRYLEKNGAFIRKKDGTIYPVEWWNGISALLDLTNPFDVEWLHTQAKRLMCEYSVDGFKFDAGDTRYYSEDQKTYRPCSPSVQTELWGKFALEYSYNELRACYSCAGLPLIQRLSDKRYSWGKGGLAELIPGTVMQGLLGYQYGCPDMVGGGDYIDFLPDAKSFDSELFLRYAGACALLPMIQFSAAPWRVLNNEEFKYLKSLMIQREQYLPEIMRLVRESAKTGVSAVRHMEYVFPNEGFARVKDQFMLGNNILVAPCIEKGKTERKVRLPKGKWRLEDKTIYDGSKTITVTAPLDRIPVFIKED